MEKSGSDTASSFPVGPRRIIAARAKLPSPERTLEAGRAKIRLWNERAYRGGQGGRQGSVVGQPRHGSQVNDDFGLTRRCDSLGAPNHLGDAEWARQPTFSPTRTCRGRA